MSTQQIDILSTGFVGLEIVAVLFFFLFLFRTIRTWKTYTPSMENSFEHDESYLEDHKSFTMNGICDVIKPVRIIRKDDGQVFGLQPNGFYKSLPLMGSIMEWEIESFDKELFTFEYE